MKREESSFGRALTEVGWQKGYFTAPPGFGGFSAVIQIMQLTDVLVIAPKMIHHYFETEVEGVKLLTPYKFVKDRLQNHPEIKFLLVYGDKGHTIWKVRVQLATETTTCPTCGAEFIGAEACKNCYGV